MCGREEEAARRVPGSAWPSVSSYVEIPNEGRLRSN